MIESLAHIKQIQEDKSYVLGFAFSEDLSHMVALQKAKPAWAAGMWTVPGGKIEGDESPVAAIEREFMEECGVLIPKDQWILFGAFQRPGWFVECLVARTDEIFHAKTIEQEIIKVCTVQEFVSNTIAQEDTYGVLEASWLTGYARRFLKHPELRNDFQSVPCDNRMGPELNRRPAP